MYEKHKFKHSVFVRVKKPGEKASLRVYHLTAYPTPEIRKQLQEQLELQNPFDEIMVHDV